MSLVVDVFVDAHGSSGPFPSGEADERGGGGGGMGGVLSLIGPLPRINPTRRRTRPIRKAGVTPPPVRAKTISPGIKSRTPKPTITRPHRCLPTNLSLAQCCPSECLTHATPPASVRAQGSREASPHKGKAIRP
jgi:hypothetical protein